MARYFAIYPSPLGKLTLVGDGTNLTELLMDNHPHAQALSSSSRDDSADRTNAQTLNSLWPCSNDGENTVVRVNAQALDSSLSRDSVVRMSPDKEHFEQQVLGDNPFTPSFQGSPKKHSEQQPSIDAIVQVDTTHPAFNVITQWLDAYFDQKAPSIDGLPLAPQGSDFRQAVWAALREIPYGGLITYGQLARQIGNRLGKPRMAAQAIGGAVGANPIDIIIPCHRVIGANGNLTGYGGGLDRKVWLLHHEGHNMDAFHLPKQ